MGERLWQSKGRCLRTGFLWLIILGLFVDLAEAATVNGQCGLASLKAAASAPVTNLCVSGSASAVSTGKDIANVDGHGAGATDSNFNGIWSWSCSGSSGGSTSYCSALIPRAGSSPTDLDGNGYLGGTSYKSAPFFSQVFKQSWGSSSGDLDPANLFAGSDPNSYLNIFQNSSAAKTCSEGRSVIAQDESQGLIAFNGAQIWEDTWEASFPNDYYVSEPNSIQPVSSGLQNDINGDRAKIQSNNTKSFFAWRDWLLQRSDLLDVAYNGGSVGLDYQTYGLAYGYVNPLTPLDAADCPPGMTNCTFGDFWSYRESLWSNVSGVYMINLSDGTAGLYGTTNTVGFNPRVIASFQTQTGIQVPPGTQPQQANWIITNHLTDWTDFTSKGFGQWFRSLHRRFTQQSGREALVSTQDAQNGVIGVRGIGQDPRIIATQIDPKNYIQYWDQMVIGVGKPGWVCVPPMKSIASYGEVAAYEPLIRNGPEMESDDQAFWAGIVDAYSPSADEKYFQSQGCFIDTQDLSGGASVNLQGVTVSLAQEEIGYKLMKRQWLWAAWAHIADQNGQVRRAFPYFSRDYADVGTLTALNTGSTNFGQMLQSVIPTHAFGPAFYYSRSMAVGIETYLQQNGGPYANLLNDFAPFAVQQFSDAGGAGNYFISDTALPALNVSSQDAPSAILIPQTGQTSDHDSINDITELSQLKAIAPVIDMHPVSYPYPQNKQTGSSPGAVNAVTLLNQSSSGNFPKQPLILPPGLTGFAFYDQQSRLILVISNASTHYDAVENSGNVMLNSIKKAGSLAQGTFTITNLLSGQISSITIENGSAALAVALSRWDSQVFAISL